MGVVLDAFIAFVVLVFLGLMALDIRGIFAGEKASMGSRYRPRALVIVPCKGLDLTLSENLMSLKGQKYGSYSIIAVVDSESDEAVPVIRDAGIRHIISRSRCTRCSKKVRAISTALESMRDYSAYAVADSDICVDERWLERLIEPLADRRIGLSTMFPYFNPIHGFWSKVKMVWGFVGEGLLESETTRFGWGGSLAFRKELLGRKEMDFLKDSEYSVSDDICLTKIARGKGLGIAYTRQSQPIVNTSESFRSFAEWSNRQTALTLLGYRRNLYFGLAFYSAEALELASGIALAFYVSPLFLILLLHAARSVAKTYQRSRKGDPVIALIALAMPFIYIANLLHASRARSITWRGTAYKLTR